MNIEQYLMANPRFIPETVLIPENCALCALEEDKTDLYHIEIDDGFARIQLFNQG